MNEKEYKGFVNEIKRLTSKDGRPIYILADDIGVGKKTLYRFFNYNSVSLFTVIAIANYFGLKLCFVKTDHGVD